MLNSKFRLVAHFALSFPALAGVWLNHEVSPIAGVFDCSYVFWVLEVARRYVF